MTLHRYFKLGFQVLDDIPGVQVLDDIPGFQVFDDIPV